MACFLLLKVGMVHIHHLRLFRSLLPQEAKVNKYDKICRPDQLDVENTSGSVGHKKQKILTKIMLVTKDSKHDQLGNYILWLLPINRLYLETSNCHLIHIPYIYRQES